MEKEQASRFSMSSRSCAEEKNDAKLLYSLYIWYTCTLEYVCSSETNAVVSKFQRIRIENSKLTPAFNQKNEDLSASYPKFSFELLFLMIFLRDF